MRLCLIDFEGKSENPKDVFNACQFVVVNNVYFCIISLPLLSFFSHKMIKTRFFKKLLI